MNRPLLLRLTLAAHVLFFAGWATWMYAQQINAPEVWLQTEPVDPRDLISGHYVALTFAIGRPSVETFPPDLAGLGKQVWVELVPSTTTVALKDGRSITPSVAGQYTREPLAPTRSSLWACGTERHAGGWAQRIHFGIERFFVNEESDLREARSGQVIARAILGRNGKLRVRELVAVKP